MPRPRNNISKRRINVKAALDTFTVVQRTLTYVKAGSGSGTVSFSPSGGAASCTANCTNSYADGQSVTLTAAAQSGSTFAGWSGACSGTAASCTVTMTAARSVTATFNPSQSWVLSYTKGGSGNGTVSFSPAGGAASCTANCSNTYANGQSVTLTAAAQSGSTFAGWSGACSGTAASCTVTMTAARSVTATFNAPPTPVLSYTKGGTGSGSVSFSPAGSVANCSASCTAQFAAGAKVRLMPTAAPDSVFKRWEGACEGAKRCRVSMTEARAVTAVFDLIPSFALTLDATGNGTGSVSFAEPPGVAPCTGDCTRSFADGSRVTLVAQAGASSRFTGWGGACSGMKTCTVGMTQARTVTAAFTTVPSFTLTYDAVGSGAGSVSFAAPAGVTPCAADCTRSFAEGTEVILTAQAAANSRFAGWGGACSGAKICKLPMTQARTVTATFNTVPTFALTYDATGNGTGTVSFAQEGVSPCTGDCSRSFVEGSRVTLVAQAGANSRFAGWGGACRGKRASCRVSMTQAQTVTATFTPR